MEPTLFQKAHSQVAQIERNVEDARSDLHQLDQFCQLIQERHDPIEVVEVQPEEFKAMRGLLERALGKLTKLVRGEEK